MAIAVAQAPARHLDGDAGEVADLDEFVGLFPGIAQVEDMRDGYFSAAVRKLGPDLYVGIGGREVEDGR